MSLTCDSRNDLISRSEAINRSYWHGEIWNIYKACTSGGSQATDVRDLETLPSEKNRLAAEIWDKTPEEVYDFLEKLYKSANSYTSTRGAIIKWLNYEIEFPLL